MRVLIRVDGDARMGGGHVMRCLTLADAAVQRGWEVAFVTSGAPESMADRIGAAGHAVTLIPPTEVPPDPEAPAHGHWLRADWRSDAQATGAEAALRQADWLVWDHYGLDARWVAVVRGHRPGLKVLALDDLDDRDLGCDLLLDQTRLAPGPRRHAVMRAMTGPDYALLRPEFQTLRAASLGRRGGTVSRVIVMPGMMDAAGLAPLALEALREFPDLRAEVVMAAASQSSAAVTALCAGNPAWDFTPEPADLAARMVAADLCIGAGGMTGWERCCIGLPSIAVAVARNQLASLAGLAKAGAALTLSLQQARAGGLGPALRQAIPLAEAMSARAAALCDGRGAGRVLDAMDAHLRPVTEDDAQQLFDWRNRPRIRAMSIDRSELVWTEHLDWVRGVVDRDDGFWMIYAEGGRDIGHVNARLVGDGVCQWGFYIGVNNAPKGVGTRMLCAFVDRLRDHGVAEITAEVRAENAASVALHEKLGFRREEAKKAGLLAFRLSLGKTG